MTSPLIDPRLAFLACCSARHDLVVIDAMTLDEALSADFIEQFRSVAEICCGCERAIMQRWDAIYREQRQQDFRGWRNSQRRTDQRGQAVSSTADAYAYLVRLNDPDRLRAFLESHPEIVVQRRRP
jgi:hypothetical protein